MSDVMLGAETWRIPAAVSGLPSGWSGTRPAHAEAAAASAARYQGHSSFLNKLHATLAFCALYPIPLGDQSFSHGNGSADLSTLSLRRFNVYKQAWSPWATGPASLPASSSHAANASGTLSMRPALITLDPTTSTSPAEWDDLICSSC